MFSYLFIAWTVDGDTMMDRMAMVSAFKKLSLVGNTDIEQVISRVSVMQEKFGSLWKQPSQCPGLILENSTLLEGLIDLEKSEGCFVSWCIKENTGGPSFPFSPLPGLHYLSKHGLAPSFFKYTSKECNKVMWCGGKGQNLAWDDLGLNPSFASEKSPHTLRIITVPPPPGLLWALIWSFTWKCFANYGALFSRQLPFHKSLHILDFSFSWH